MTIREFDPVSAIAVRDEPTNAPVFNNSVLDRAPTPPMTRLARLLGWILAALLAAAACLAVAYWSYRLVQPSPLFAPASASAERAAGPAAAAGAVSVVA